MLEKIKNPSDLKKLSIKKLPVIAKEIREKIVDTVSHTGGHLASSLGAVDLTVALHYCLDTPRDIIIWDVGHQTYAHKLLTGRYENFSTLRQLGGVSGFPSKDESAYDTFTTGHSSTAISLALGMAAARDIKKAKQKIVAVIGDGSLTGGLCFEALNNAGHLNKDILVILNTNEMSIAPSVGALSNYLNKIISKPIYNRFREAFQNFVKTKIPLVGSRMLKLASKFEEFLKGLIVPGIFFEELGFRYFGPLDGHNLELLINTLKNVSSLKGPKVLHVVTKKGKGYEPAENMPIRFHSAAPFDIKTGKSKSVTKDKNLLSYTEVFSNKIVELAKKDSKIAAITAAMPDGTGLYRFAQAFPDRFFDVGIAEEHAICFSAGLAKSGLKPVVAIYSTFLQRAYDQIMEAVALQNLPVTLAIDRAGIVGADGVTHQGIFDIAYLKSIPNFVLMAPKDLRELEAMLEFAVDLNKPVAIRYPKTSEQLIKTDSSFEKIKLGKSQVIKEGKDIALIALGTMVTPAFEAAGDLAKDNIDAMVVNSRFIKPLDEDLLKNIASRFKTIVTLEEGIIDGGFGVSVLEKINQFSEDKETPKVLNLGLATDFVTHGTREELLKKSGLDKESIVEKTRAFIKSSIAWQR